MRQDEQCVRDLVSCIDEFDTFPFNPASTALRTLQSAMPASDELVADFKSAHAAGEEKLAIFLQERVFSKNTSLHSELFEFKWHVQKDAEEQSTSEALPAICIYSGKIYSTC